MLFALSLVRSQDYPGLLRVIAWVVNGLDLLVENARCVLGSCAALASTCSSFPTALHISLEGFVCFLRQSWPAGW